VCNKQPKSEILLDVNDAPGHTPKQKRSDPGQWVWSEQPPMRR
jgi:hypothetical protein